MKKLFILMMFCLPIAAMAQQKVAVYVTSNSNEVDEAAKQIIGTELVSAIIKTNQYDAVERTADFLSQISTEQGYQRSGNVDDNQISALGKQFGVDYVCVANLVVYSGNTYYIQARLIDVETATVHSVARETSSLNDIDEMILASSKVASKLFNVNVEGLNMAKRSPQKTTITASSSTNTLTEDPQSFIVHNSRSVRKSLNVKEYSYNKIQMDKKEYEQFLSKNCLLAYDKFVKGKKLITSGWVMLGCGLGFVVGGVGLSTVTDMASIVSALGSLMTVSSAVLLPIGYVYRSKSVDVFNDKCSKNTKVACSFQLQSSSNGFGMNVSF